MRRRARNSERLSESRTRTRKQTVKGDYRPLAACRAPEKRTFAVPVVDRSPANDQSGDVVDGWRVLGIKPNERQ